MMGDLSKRAGAAAAATGGAVGGGLIGGALGGAAGGAVGYGANYAGQKVIMQNDVGWDWGELGMATVKGGATGAIGAGASSVSNGATGAILGGFAGGATGSALNGEDRWGILKGGLIGAGLAFATYSVEWGYDNYSGGEKIDQSSGTDQKGIDPPLEPEGDFVADEHLQEAHRILTEERNKLKANGEDPMEYEIGASFRIRRHFWSGKEYVAATSEMTPVHISQSNFGTEFDSYTGNHFRMHLHPGEMSLGIGRWTDPYHPSAADYANALFWKNYGISSYAGAVKNGQVNLYHYAYDNGTPKYWVAQW